jgi:hypothetical protein
MQDIRLNPRRYNTVKLKIFGGNKVKDYKVPAEDPAYRLMMDSLEREYSRKIDSIERREELLDPTQDKVKVKGR